MTSVGGARTADDEATPGSVKKFIADHGATVYAVRCDYNVQIPDVITRPVVFVFVQSADSVVRTDKWGRKLPLREIKTKTLAKSLGLSDREVRTQDAWEVECTGAVVADVHRRTGAGEASLDDVRDFLTLASGAMPRGAEDIAVRDAVTAVASVMESPHGHLVPDDHPARIAYLALARGRTVWTAAVAGASAASWIAAARDITTGYDHTVRSDAWTGSALLLGAGIPHGLGDADETLRHAARYLASTGGTDVTDLM